MGGAVLASALTTVAVFLPVLFVEEVAGQLFRDIALAISCAVGLSLLVSFIVIPTASARLFARDAAQAGSVPRKNSLNRRVRDVLDSVGGRIVRGIVNINRFIQRGWLRSLVLVVLLVAVSLGAAWP